MGVNNWLKKYRGERSQADVAERCGISQQALSAIELGKKRPSVKLAKLLAAELGFDWTRFYTELPK